MNEQSVTIRAMPPMGLSQRYRAGRPWSKTPLVVRIVDEPAKPKVETDVNGKVMTTWPEEISVRDLAALQADPHFSVTPVGPGIAAADEVNTVKLQMIELGDKLREAQRDLAGAIEETKSLRDVGMKEAEEKGAQVARLEKELADAKAMIAHLQESDVKGRRSR